MSDRIQNLIKVFLILIFLLCLLQMPYGYYQFVRLFGMGGFIWLAYIDNERKNGVLKIIWIISAILINPIVKIPLGRLGWNIVDVVWVVILSFTIIQEMINSKKIDK